MLLVGESGSGKSRAARHLHDAGPRRDGPFVAVQLAGLAPSLIDAELFGHAAGAFTGAAREREGRFLRASGGTLVLEGVETLGSDLQVKLLRVLQERVIEPLGSDATVPVDVRVVATSTLDLAAEAAAGRFRGDLYYRLAVLTLAVPSLRERRDAIPELAATLARAVAQRLGVPARPLGEAALARLAAHPWPGNVRELENALERVLVLGEAEGPVEAAELDFLAEALAGSATRLARAALAAGLGADELLAALLDEALASERGNASAAARRVGLSRRAFEYRRSRANPGGDGEGADGGPGAEPTGPGSDERSAAP